MRRPVCLGAFASMTAPWATIPDSDWGINGRPTRRVERRAHLLEQLFAGVRLRDKPTKPLRQHGADFVLLGKSAAQNDVNASD